MKYQLYTFVMLVTVLMFATCQTFIEASVSIINSSGHVANIDRTLIGFTAIEIYVDAHVTVMHSDNSRLIIQPDHDLMASIQSEAHQGTLMISIDLCHLTQGEVVGSCDVVPENVEQLYISFRHDKKQDLS